MHLCAELSDGLVIYSPRYVALLLRDSDDIPEAMLVRD
jgi:hypothetical protein